MCGQCPNCCPTVCQLLFWIICHRSNICSRPWNRFIKVTEGHHPHFVFNCYLGYLWCFTRVCVRAPSGRQRWNVLGALHAITHELITITNETYITSTEVCALLRKIAAAHVDQIITVVLDNARYQRCAKVQECAQVLGIELLFLPPYSPNLNLICGL